MSYTSSGGSVVVVVLVLVVLVVVLVAVVLVVVWAGSGGAVVGAAFVVAVVVVAPTPGSTALVVDVSSAPDDESVTGGGATAPLDSTAELHPDATSANARSLGARRPLMNGHGSAHLTPVGVAFRLSARRRYRLDMSVRPPDVAVAGFRCAVCGAFVDIATAAPWQCPNRSIEDPDHVLHVVAGASVVESSDEPHPFVRYGPRLAWWSFARANGVTADSCERLTRQVAEGFVVTPFDRSAGLSGELGCDVWVKDETGQVAGSQKGRHLLSILLHLLAAEQLGLITERAPLAIASCGNAAMAAATLARRVRWPIDVYVPTWMDAMFGRRLDELGARIHRCERRVEDPAGDPAMLRFREAVAAGSIPFSVQGPENALCLDGGRTMGWEISDGACAAGARLDRVFVQVGGGAFAASVGAGLDPDVRLDTVQAEGCAPLAAAWERARGVDDPAAHWNELMRPWPEPQSAADGILDDETYDWLADLDVMRRSGGRPIVATEAEIVRAHELATAAGYAVSVTGAAGLAGLLHVRDEIDTDDTVAVIMSGAAQR